MHVADHTLDSEPRAWSRILRVVPEILRHFTEKNVHPTLDQIYVKAGEIGIGMETDNRNLLRHALKCMGAEEGSSNALYQLRKLAHVSRNDWHGQLKRWPSWGEHRDKLRPGQLETAPKVFGEAMNWVYGRFKDIPDHDRLSHLLPHVVKTLYDDRGGYAAHRSVSWPDIYKAVELHEMDADSFEDDLKPELDKLQEAHAEHLKSNRMSSATPSEWALMFSQENEKMGGSGAMKDTFKVYETAAGRPQLPAPSISDGQQYNYKRSIGGGGGEEDDDDEKKGGKKEEKEGEPKKKKGPLTVEPIVMEKDQYPEIARERPNMHSFAVPSFPSLSLFVGGTGSGKTSAIAFLMTSPNAYGGDLEHSNLHPFHKPQNIYLFGPSMDSDPTWVEVRKTLKIPDKNVYVDMTVEDLKEVLDEMDKRAKKHKDKINCPRHLLIYDDAIADEQFVMSDETMRSAVRHRHLCLSVWFSTQSLKKAPRLLRMQAQAILYWSGNATRQDQEILYEEWGSGGMSKKDWFRDIMPKFRDKHTFLYINRNLDPTERYRVNFDDIINWVHVEDAATQRYKEKMGKGNQQQQQSLDHSHEASSSSKKQKLIK